MLSRAFVTTVTLLSLLCLLFWLQSPAPPMELTGTPSLHSNQLQEDFRRDWVRAIDGAQNSITWAIYSLKDRHLVRALRRAAERGVEVEVIFDPSGSGALEKRLGPKIKTHRRKTHGLMHHKVLVVDNAVCLGSCNGTTASLRYHGNLILWCEDSVLAGALRERVASLKGPRGPPHQNPLKAGNLEIWWLPDTNACRRLVHLLDGAEKSVRVAMFTWTHPDLSEAIIRAHRRGLQVEVVIDAESSAGTSKIAFEALKTAGVAVKKSEGSGLLHHKWAWVDGHTLAHGSANWTRSAFKRNDDLLCVMTELNEEQQEWMKRLWKRCYY